MFKYIKVKTKGQIEGEKLLEPKLRFKKFEDSYKKYKLKEIVDFYKGNTLSKSDIAEKGKTPCILYGELYTKYSEIAYKIFSFTNNRNSNLFYSKKNDVLIPCSGETALDISTSTCVLFDNIAIGGDLNVLRLKNQDGKYLSYLLSHKKRIEIAKYAQGDSIVHLYADKIKNINIYLPNYIEQEKVSDFLSLLDKKIELQKRKVDALKIYKRGLIKKVFAKLDGKQIPLKLILKETFNYAQKGHEYPHVTLSKDGIYEKTDRYNRDFLVKDSSKQYKITHKYDLCYNPANLKFGVICLNLYGSAIFSPIYVTFEINKNYHPEFVAYYLCRSEFINYIRRYEQGTVYERMAVNSTDFLKYNLTIPSYEKQEKIVKLLNSLENKINNNLKIYHDFEKIKKGLLQQMFI